MIHHFFKIKKMYFRIMYLYGCHLCTCLQKTSESWELEGVCHPNCTFMQVYALKPWATSLVIFNYLKRYKQKTERLHCFKGPIGRAAGNWLLVEFVLFCFNLNQIKGKLDGPSLHTDYLGSLSRKIAQGFYASLGNILRHKAKWRKELILGSFILVYTDNIYSQTVHISRA